MNNWIKYRFWVAGFLFIIGVAAALVVLLSDFTIVDKELRYAIALASIGTSFTAAQFYFQINETRFKNIQDKSFREGEIKLQVHKELMEGSSILLDIVHKALGSYKQVDLEELETSFLIASNSFKNTVGHYSSLIFEGLDDTNEFIDLCNSIDSTLITISKYRKEVRDHLNKQYDGNSDSIEFEVIYFNWHNETRDTLKDALNQRQQFLKKTRDMI